MDGLPGCARAWMLLFLVGYVAGCAKPSAPPVESNERSSAPVTVEDIHEVFESALNGPTSDGRPTFSSDLDLPEYDPEDREPSKIPVPPPDAIQAWAEFVQLHSTEHGPREIAYLTDDQVTAIATELRGQFPYRSLRQRLQYEEHLPARAKPKLNLVAELRLNEIERPHDTENSRSRSSSANRSRSLAMLHSDIVRKFVTQVGFGISRMSPPGPTYLALSPDERQPKPAEAAPELSGEHLSGAVLSLPSSGAEVAQNPYWLPRLENLSDMHDDGAYEFASPRRNGHIRNLGEVAGFEPHAVTTTPRPVRTADLWMVARMELVSLLKHETAQVYVSANLPRMEDAASAPLRSPDDFERAALQRLQEGEHLVVEAWTNRIAMLGAIRAEKRCTECHKVERGELLGAFSYELVRRNPIAPAKAPKPAS